MQGVLFFGRFSIIHRILTNQARFLLELLHCTTSTNWNYTMKKICLLVAITLCSWLGWMLGDSFGIMTAYLMSFAGSLAGVFLGCFINRQYLNY